MDTVGSEKLIPSCTYNCIHTSLSLDSRVTHVCFQFSFVCLVWFTGFISLVPPWHVSVARPCFDLKRTLSTFWVNPEDTWFVFFLGVLSSPPSSRDLYLYTAVVGRSVLCISMQGRKSLNLTVESFKRPHNHLGFPSKKKKSVLPSSLKHSGSKWHRLSQPLSYVRV